MKRKTIITILALFKFVAALLVFALRKDEPVSAGITSKAALGD